MRAWRILAALALAALSWTEAAANTPANAVTRPVLNKLAPCGHTDVYCAGANSEFTYLCNAAGTSATTTCAAGSAMAAWAANDPNSTSWATFLLEEQTFQEFVRVKDRGNFTVKGLGPRALVRPDITDPNSVAGGCFNWQPLTSSTDRANVILEGFQIHCDDVLAGNLATGALEVGDPSDPSNATSGAKWSGLSLIDMEITGGTYGVFLGGDYVGGDVTKFPKWSSRGGKYVGGKGAFVFSGLVRGHLDRFHTYQQTNFCDTSAIVIQGGAVGAGSTTTTVPLVDGENDYGWGDGRTLTMTGGSCNVNGEQRAIEYTTPGASTPTVLVTRAFSAAPNTSCTWSLAPRAMRITNTCTDKPWPRWLGYQEVTGGQGFANIFSVMQQEDGGTLSTHGPLFDGSYVLITNGIMEGYVNNGANETARRGPGFISRLNMTERVVLMNVAVLGAHNYEEGPDGKTCSPTSSVQLSYPNHLEQFEAYNLSIRYDNNGRNCDSFGILGSHTSQSLRLGRILLDEVRPATVNGLAITAGLWDIDAEVSVDTNDYRSADIVNLSNGVRTRQPGTQIWNGMGAADGYQVSLSAGDSAVAEITFPFGADNCYTYPVTLTSPVSANTIRWENGPTATAGADTQAMCLYTADWQTLVAGWENLTGAAGVRTANSTTLNNGTPNFRRMIMPGQYQFVWCSDNGSGNKIMGHPSTAGSRTYRTGGFAAGSSDGTSCPAVASPPGTWAIPNRLDVTIHE